MDPMKHRGRNRLMNRFHDLAKGSGSISASVPRSALVAFGFAMVDAINPALP